MDNTNEILKIFLADRNEFRAWMNKPFTFKGKTGATNSYSVVLLPINSDYDNMDAKIEQIYPIHNCSIQSSINNLKDCFAKIPLVSLPAEETCLECLGHGEVEYEYDGNTGYFSKDIECPVCKGEGFTIDKSKKGESVPDSKKCIKIGNTSFPSARASEIIKTADLLDIEYFTLIHQSEANKPSLFSLNEVEILIAGGPARPDDIVSILESEASNG